MKITRDKMFFSKDLIHTLAYVGMFVAAIISVGACKSGIWVAAILAWIVAGIIIGLAIISDYKKAELLKNGTRIIGKVTATKRVHIKFHMSTYHLSDDSCSIFQKFCLFIVRNNRQSDNYTCYNPC